MALLDGKVGKGIIGREGKGGNLGRGGNVGSEKVGVFMKPLLMLLLPIGCCGKDGNVGSINEGKFDVVAVEEN
ncbi:hypothetical protein AHAS_Ahas13G0285900 [Arachis hypogaea]